MGDFTPGREFCHAKTNPGYHPDHAISPDHCHLFLETVDSAPLHDPLPVKITFGEMRESGVRWVLVYSCDYKCSHLIEMDADCWPDHLRLSDIEDRFTCTRCGKRGAEVRSNF